MIRSIYQTLYLLSIPLRIFFVAIGAIVLYCLSPIWTEEWWLLNDDSR